MTTQSNPSARYLATLCIAMATFMLISINPALASETGKASPPKTLGNAAALAGVDHAKSVFLVKLDSAEKAAGYLKAIRGTHQGLVKQGVRSDIVVVFIGKVVQYLSTVPAADLLSEHGEALESIASTAADLKSLGVQMEVCGAATKHFGVDNATILDEMAVVDNGFISLIGWQSQGYVPMTF